MRITSALVDPALLDLPWSTPLEEWPADHLVALPQGISRHVVRFVKLDGTVYAVKETARTDRRTRVRPAARAGADRLPVGRGGRDRRRPASTADGEPLEPVLVTRHLQFSLPYRALFSHTLRPETMNRLLDALAALLVRMHLTGFFWGDCSLSNTLFRRDAGAFAAYLVDAETGALHPRCPTGQRSEDLEIARLNIFGEALDLQAAGLLHEAIDPEDGGRRGRRAATSGCGTRSPTSRRSSGTPGTTSRSRIRRLNDLGFDVAEVAMSVIDGRRRTGCGPRSSTPATTPAGCCG